MEYFWSMFINMPFQGVVSNSGGHNLLSLISRSSNTYTLSQSDLIYLEERLISYLSPDYDALKTIVGRIFVDTSIEYKGVSFTYVSNIIESKFWYELYGSA